jgi:hypothetical protein
MKAKLFPPATSFLRVCRYVSQDLGRSQVLDTEGVRGHHYRLMAHDFKVIHALRPGREKMVFHGGLAFLPDEKIDDARMIAIGRKYLSEIGMTDTQFAIVKHIDKPRPHIHIVANRINFSGQYINNYPERLRSWDAERNLIREYGLIPIPEKKNLRLTNLEALNRSEARLYAIYRCIMESLPGCHHLEDLEARLLKEGVDTQYRYNEQTGERQGISFRYQQEAFKGSRIDRAFALGRLQQTLAQQQELALWEQRKIAELQQEKLVCQERQEQALREQKEKALREQQELALRQERQRSQKRTPEHENHRHRNRHSHELGL